MEYHLGKSVIAGPSDRSLVENYGDAIWEDFADSHGFRDDWFRLGDVAIGLESLAHLAPATRRSYLRLIVENVNAQPEVARQLTKKKQFWRFTTPEEQERENNML